MRCCNCRTWLVSGRGIARKIKNCTQFSACQVEEGTDAHRLCPNCNHCIDNSEVSVEWPGLPAGVKFEPSDAELLEHLAGKVGLGNLRPHLFLDEFIPTLQHDDGICYTHPENLPGIKKDGSCGHFFHRTSNAYATGKRKRRKINSHGCSLEERVRWHKTGQTRPVMVDGIQRGCKKIMVLYKSSKKGLKPDKDKWVMHQFHLGTEDNETEGELVVSRIFYQQQSKSVKERDSTDVPIKASDMMETRVGPTTPKTCMPHPPRICKNSPCDEADDGELQLLHNQVADVNLEMPQASYEVTSLEDECPNPAWWAGHSQDVEAANLVNIDDPLLCNEVIDFHLPFQELEAKHIPHFADVGCSGINMHEGDSKPSSEDFDLNNMEFEMLQDSQLADLQFGSQESILSWLDRL